MSRTTYAPGDRVTIADFGLHEGEVIGPHPKFENWVTVRLLDQRRIWNGHVDEVKPPQDEPSAQAPTRTKRRAVPPLPKTAGEQP